MGATDEEIAAVAAAEEEAAEAEAKARAAAEAQDAIKAKGKGKTKEKEGNNASGVSQSASSLAPAGDDAKDGKQAKKGDKTKGINNKPDKEQDKENKGVVSDAAEKGNSKSQDDAKDKPAEK